MGQSINIIVEFADKSAVETIFKFYFVVFLFATQSYTEIWTSLKFETFDKNNPRKEIKPLRDSILCDIADSKREREGGGEILREKEENREKEEKEREHWPPILTSTAGIEQWMIN